MVMYLSTTLIPKLCRNQIKDLTVLLAQDQAPLLKHVEPGDAQYYNTQEFFVPEFTNIFYIFYLNGCESKFMD